ncbi:hypothetical protein BV22DRAFT_386535 [Leucogyrophana mollusca]|uniref:Uncharacterized protein n=1 Tax=Leucogyrophana mollusca TaxID=85980 RepID=A0ACB8BLI6_9AGAM|nr:hypothetical protein BV22DRAFT_386535 [Leucogyrophana mollusca]
MINEGEKRPSTMPLRFHQMPGLSCSIFDAVATGPTIGRGGGSVSGRSSGSDRLREAAVYTKPSSAPASELHAMSDSDSLIQALYQIQLRNYITMATGAAVMYDQVLNFSQEVDHIWNRRWGLTTALYVVARYSGSLSLFTNIACTMVLEGMSPFR